MKKIFLFLAMLMIAATFMGCVSSDAEKPDTIVIASQQDFAVLDPYNTTATPDMNANWCIFDSLINMDIHGNIEPLIAESWEITEDGTEYIFHLREGILFHDGTPMTAEDVVFSAQLMKESPFKMRVAALFDGAEVIDDHTMKFILPQKAAPFMYELAYNFLVVSKKAYTEMGESFKDHPVGCGPYRIISKDSGEGVTLKAFEDYYGNRAPIENIVYKVIPDASTALISLENGEIDLCQYVPSASYPLVLDNDKLDLLKTEYTRVFNLILNTTAEPFKDNVALRQAIAHAIDKQFLVDVALEGYGSVAITLVNDSFIAAPKHLADYAVHYNLERAKELLAEAGYPNGEGLPTLQLATIEMFKKQAEIVQAQLKEIGINMEINMYELSTYLAMQAGGELQVGMMSTNQGGDASVMAIMLIEGSTNNGACYANPKVTELFAQAAAELDDEKRSVIYDELYKIVIEDMPYVSIYYPDTVSCGRKDLDFATIMDYVAYKGHYYSFK